MFGNEAQQDTLADSHLSFICLHISTGYTTRVSLTDFFFFALLKHSGRSTQFLSGKRAENCAGLQSKFPACIPTFIKLIMNLQMSGILRHVEVHDIR
jgi:hypothetical protein